MKRAPVELIEWWCGDEYCDCTEWKINKVEPNPKAPGWVIPTTIWTGTFYTDGERPTEDDFRAAIKAAHELGAFIYSADIATECVKLGIVPPPIWAGE